MALSVYNTQIIGVIIQRIVIYVINSLIIFQIPVEHCLYKVFRIRNCCSITIRKKNYNTYSSIFSLIRTIDPAPRIYQKTSFHKVRSVYQFRHPGMSKIKILNGPGWVRTTVGVSQWIYSPSPLNHSGTDP